MGRRLHSPTERSQIGEAQQIHFPSIWQLEYCCRFEPGTKDTLITNATLWLEDGAKPGDIFLEKGIIKDIGNISDVMDNKRGLNIVDAKGAWITPGLSM